MLTLIFCSLTLISKSQTASVEKATLGIQTGFLGIWVNYEMKLSNQLVLRTELGFDAGIWGGRFYEKTGYVFIPVVNLEPRWYYNLNKRMNKEKRIDGNSGNFISLKTGYHPDWFVISNYDNNGVISDISVIPTWGIRRSIGSRLTFETGFGLGYRYYFAKAAGYLNNEGEAAVNLHLRFGYRF